MIMDAGPCRFGPQSVPILRSSAEGGGSEQIRITRRVAAVTRCGWEGSGTAREGRCLIGTSRSTCSNLTSLVGVATRCAKNTQLVDLVASAPSEIRRPSGGPTRTRARRLTADQVAQLATNRLAGSEINELADQCGIDRTTVIRHLQRAGVPGRRRQGRTLDRKQLQAAGEMYVAGHSVAAVAEQFDVDRRYLRKVLPEAGFPLRSPGRQRDASR